jgi:hypothetical protein
MNWTHKSDEEVNDYKKHLAENNHSIPDDFKETLLKETVIHHPLKLAPKRGEGFD